jgi:polyketide cyclase/dehydrase/lipid transport protein
MMRISLVQSFGAMGGATKLVTIAAIAVVALVVFLAYVSTRPGTIFIERNAVIETPPEAVFALIDDFHNWPSWSPQDRDDPSMVRSYGGPSRGVGATSDWTSKGQAGAGRMTIIGAAPATEIVVAVQFQRPFKAHNINTFRFEREGDGATRVTWSMRGTNVFVMKLMSVVVSPNRVMGSHFEKGLASLKALAEKKAV